MEYLFIYGLQFADAISVIKNILTALLIAYIVLTVVTLQEIRPDDEDLKKWWNLWIKKILIFLIVTPLILFLLPTKQTMLLIGGTYLGKKAVSAVATSDKLEKINTIIDLQLDKYIKELQRGE